VASDIVSHAANWPEVKPLLNQRLRWAELPWVNASGTTFLQAVVTNGRRGLQRLINVPRLEEIVLLLSTVRPNASEATRLQLDAHLQLVRLRLA
jgi:hypothetical protein